MAQVFQKVKKHGSGGQAIQCLRVRDGVLLRITCLLVDSMLVNSSTLFR